MTDLHSGYDEHTNTTLELEDARVCFYKFTINTRACCHRTRSAQHSSATNVPVHSLTDSLRELVEIQD